MTKLYLTVTGASASVEKIGPLTTGMVGAGVECSFDDTWDQLNRLVVFRCGEIKKDNSLKEGKTTVPHEVLTQPGQMLYIGVEGRSGDGTLVIPTVWAEAGRVFPGAGASGDPALAPTPTQFERFMAEVEQVDEKINDALQEARESGDFDGADGVSVTHAWDGTALTVTSASGTSRAELKGEKGDKGDPGLDGSTITDITATKPGPNMDTGAFGGYVNIRTARPDGSNEKTFSYWVQHGRDGKDGKDGKDGQPGQDGKDYALTDADKAEIAAQAAQLVDVPEGGMGGADWNAAEGEEGYVRNRTHYHQKQILLPETKVIFGSGGVQDDRADVPFVSLVVGESYTVNWNGREYITQARDISATAGTEAYGLGNLGSLSGINMEETGEPFIMEFVPLFKVGLCMTADGSYGSENTVSIVKETLCKLPGKFLPAGVPYVEKGEEVEITISGEWMEEDPVDHPGEWMYLFTSPIGLKAGNTYIVNWNGTDYECVAFEVDLYGDGSVLFVCLGNASAGGSGMEDTGEPFLMQEVPAEFAAEMGAYGVAASIDYMGNIPFSIKGEDATIHKLDPRCLPDSVGNLYTADFDVIVASDDSISATAKQSFAEVYAKANDPNTFVRGFMKLKFYDMYAGMKPLYFGGVTKDTSQNPVIEFMALDRRDSNVVCWTVSYSSDGTVTVTGL